MLVSFYTIHADQCYPTKLATMWECIKLTDRNILEKTLIIQRLIKDLVAVVFITFLQKHRTTHCWQGILT